MGRRRQQSAHQNRRSCWAPPRIEDYHRQQHARVLRQHITGLVHRPIQPPSSHPPMPELFGNQKLGISVDILASDTTVHYVNYIF